MKKLFLFSLMLLLSTGAWAEKLSVTLKMTDGSEKNGRVDFPEPADKDFKFFPTDGDKSSKIASADVALMIVMLHSGEVVEYEYVPCIGPMNVVKKSGKIGGYAWLQVQMRGYMTLYHNRTEASVRTISPKGNTMNPGSTTKYCRREGEPGASLVLTTFSAGTNGFFKRLAKVYFDDDQEILEKILDETYTYKDLETIVRVYNDKHGNK